VQRGFVSLLALLVTLSAAKSARADDAVVDEKALGNQAMSEMNYADALAHYEKALAANPNDAALYYNLGRVHQAREEYPEALDTLNEFQKRAPPETLAKVPALAQLVEDVRARVGAVRLTCSADAPQAKLSVGDKTRVDGCGPQAKLVRFSVPAKGGAVEVRLEDDKLRAQAARVNIVGGRPPVDVMLTVVPKSSSGTLLVQVTPASALVTVDGVVRGNPPVEIPLPAASHALDVTADGYQTKHVPFVLEAGEKKDLSLTLDKKAPITAKWWFWTGVGVVVVGLATVSYVLIVQPEKDPGTGSIPPGLVRQGLTF
jgi:hypothetical protein